MISSLVFWQGDCIIKGEECPKESLQPYTVHAYFNYSNDLAIQSQPYCTTNTYVATVLSVFFFRLFLQEVEAPFHLLFMTLQILRNEESSVLKARLVYLCITLTVS